MQKRVSLYILALASIFWSAIMALSFGKMPVNNVYWYALVLVFFVSAFAFFAALFGYRGEAIPDGDVREGALLWVKQVLTDNLLLVEYRNGSNSEVRLIKIENDDVFRKIKVAKETGGAHIAKLRPAKEAGTVWMISESGEQHIIRTGSTMGRIMRAL